ncbi:MAG: MFS transporter, partial [Nakamurella sp.]
MFVALGEDRGQPISLPFGEHRPPGEEGSPPAVEDVALPAAAAVCFLLIDLPAGALIDRWRKRRVMLTADVCRAVLLISLTAAWWLGVLTFTQIIVVATATGAATVFFDVVYQSYLPFLVGHAHIVEGNAKLQATASVSQGAGPALGGFAIKYFGAADVIAINGLGYL